MPLAKLLLMVPLGRSGKERAPVRAPSHAQVQGVLATRAGRVVP